MSTDSKLKLIRQHCGRPRLSGLARLCACLVLGLGAHAAVADETCTISAGPQIAFGSYDVYSDEDLTQNAQIEVSCTGVDSYTIEISAGSAGSFSPRRMSRSGSSHTLAYNLYTGPGPDASVWGDGSGATVTAGGLSPGLTPIYGRVFKGQNAHVGSYSDTVNLTVILD